jgi:hypothetical protein
VLDAGPNRERMIDEAHALTVARRRDLIDAADSERAAMVPLETGRNALARPCSVARIQG